MVHSLHCHSIRVVTYDHHLLLFNNQPHLTKKLSHLIITQLWKKSKAVLWSGHLPIIITKKSESIFDCLLNTKHEQSTTKLTETVSSLKQDKLSPTPLT